jgi:hypothetical protein
MPDGRSIHTSIQGRDPAEFKGIIWLMVKESTDRGKRGPCSSLDWQS